MLFILGVFCFLQSQLRALQTADSKLAELEAKHSGTEKHNWELSEKVANSSLLVYILFLSRK